MEAERDDSVDGVPAHDPPHAAKRPEGDCAHEPHERKVAREPSPALVVERAAALFRALGDTARLSLLERLAGGEYCVTELAEATGEGLSTISQRLRTLRSERLLRRRRVGKHVYYTLSDHHVADLIRSALEHAAEPH
ncbi:MAG: Transcriptional regulator, ArsR family [Myxococcaceae bacterium]|nr:Transcriptional regulator, ArsR family [Myxococcaceae bacterium]